MSPAESILLSDLRHFQATGGNDLLLSRRDVATMVALLERVREQHLRKEAKETGAIHSNQCARCLGTFKKTDRRYLLNGDMYCLPCIRAIAPEDSHE